MNLVAVANACAVECVRQKVGLREVGYLLNAYDWLADKNTTWGMFFSGPMPLDISDFDILGATVEPQKNRRGFRNTPVTFQNGGSSCHPQRIREKMTDLVNLINNGRDDYKEHPETFARRVTAEFLWIHPFNDGNGRVGFMLWNYLMETLDNPVALPDFNW